MRDLFSSRFTASLEKDAFIEAFEEHIPACEGTECRPGRPMHYEYCEQL